jgi:hypothetical protein
VDYVPLVAAAAAGIGNGVVVKMSSGGPHAVLYPGIYEGALIAGGAFLGRNGNNDVAEALVLVGTALLAARALYKVAPNQVTAGYVAHAATTSHGSAASGSHGGSASHSSGSAHSSTTSHAAGTHGGHSPARAAHSGGLSTTERRGGSSYNSHSTQARRGTDSPQHRSYVAGQLPHGFDSGVGAVNWADAGMDYGQVPTGQRATTAGYGGGDDDGQPDIGGGGRVARPWFANQLGSGRGGAQVAGISTPGPWVGPRYDNSLLDPTLYGVTSGPGESDYYTYPQGRIA